MGFLSGEIRTPIWQKLSKKRVFRETSVPALLMLVGEKPIHLATQSANSLSSSLADADYRTRRAVE